MTYQVSEPDPHAYDENPDHVESDRLTVEWDDYLQRLSAFQVPGLLHYAARMMRGEVRNWEQNAVTSVLEDGVLAYQWSGVLRAIAAVQKARE